MFGVKNEKIDPATYISTLNQLGENGTSDELTKKVQEIQRLISKKRIEPTEELEKTLVQTEFKVKTDDPKYKLISRVAKRALSEGEIITKGKTDEVRKTVLSNPEQYYFLTNRKHFISKHIMVLYKRWHNDCRIKVNEQGELSFHTGDSVNKKMQNAPEEGYHLDNFALRTKAKFHETLQPNFQLNNHDGKFYVCAVTDAPEENPGLNGHHAWLRLINDQGEVISIGKFPKAFGMGEIFRKHDTVFQSADRHEFLDRPGETIQEKRIPITREQFDQIKKDIESDLEKEAETGNKDREGWSHMGSNCADWVLNKLEKNQIIEPVDRDRLKKTPWLFILPCFLRKAIFYIDTKYSGKIDSFIKRDLEHLAQDVDIIGRFIIFLAGGLSEEQESYFRDLMTKAKNSAKKDISILHPYYLRHCELVPIAKPQD